MANLKSLAKDTAIYGLSSIIGRFLNYLLVPLYTAKLAAASGGYGIITNIYAYTALIMVILLFGMETTFFRFANKEGEDPHRVYSTTLITVGTLALTFIVLVLLFIKPISQTMGYADHPQYIWVMAVTVGIDAFSAIPFSYLRYQKRPLKFASLKLLNIALNITMNLIYFAVINGKDVGYAFYINLACSSILLCCLCKELSGFRWIFDRELFRRMFHYAWPLLVLSIAGILNQTADKILFPYIYTASDAHAQLGIYGAASKIAMIMAMITQAFSYAYEPFVFGKAREKDSKEMYAQAMKYFIIFTLLAYLAVIAYLDILRYIIGSDYLEGLRVVPIVMAAEIMMGIYFNLSFWYKLIDKTIWGAIFSGIACMVLVAVNVIFVPRYGYMACAWGGFSGYFTCMALSYLVGRKKNPINYPLKDIALYVVFAALLMVLMLMLNRNLGMFGAIALNTVLLLLFVALIVKRDFPLSNLPVVGKYFRKS